MINLLPEEIKEKRRYRTYRKILLLIILGVIIALLTISIWKYNTLDSYNKKLLVCERKLNRLTPIIDEIKDLNRKEEIIKEKESLLRDLEEGFNCGQMVVDLNLIIPYQVWLTEFIILKENRFRITAQTCSNQNILQTINQLNKYPYFVDVELQCSAEEGCITKFNVQGKVRI